MATEPSKPQPPYMSYGVFKSTIQILAKATVPSGPLDRRVLDGMSGADHGALMSGLKFLGFVDDERRATNVYRQLVEAWNDPAAFKGRLLEVISDKYSPVIGKIDIATGTITDLEKAFKGYGVPSGQMVTKTIRFYLKVLAECGVTVSPYLLKAKPRVPRAATNKADKTRQPGSAQYAPREVMTPKGFDRMPVPGLPNAFIQFPLDLTLEQVDLFGAVVNVLRTFAKGKSGKGEENQ